MLQIRATIHMDEWGMAWAIYPLGGCMCDTLLLFFSLETFGSWPVEKWRSSAVRAIRGSWLSAGQAWADISRR